MVRIKATTMQVYEHGRWEYKNVGKESMICHYNAWETFDRVGITLLSM